MKNRLKSNDDTLSYYTRIVGDDTLKTNRLKTAYADSFAYNGDGAAIVVGGDVYEYNWKNRLEHIDVNDSYIDHDFFYDYDFRGLRVRKEEKTVDEVFGLRGKPVIDIRYNYTYYFYDAAGRLLCEFDKNGNLSRKFVYLPSAIIQISGSDTSYLHLDNLGSPAVVTDESGNVIKEYRYYAFGNLRSQSGSFNTDYSFTGYLKEETGTHYAKMRYYEGGIGRFMRVDPLGALNPYVYCGNDPLNFVDPWGLVEKNVWKLIRNIYTHIIGYILPASTPTPIGAELSYEFLKEMQEQNEALDEILNATPFADSLDLWGFEKEEDMEEDTTATDTE